MRYLPQADVARFAQLKAGDLFLMVDQGFSTVGMKTIMSGANGDEFVAILGPNYGEVGAPHLLDAFHFTAITLREWTLMLPTQPNGWSITEPAPEDASVLLADG